MVEEGVIIKNERRSSCNRAWFKVWRRSALAPRGWMNGDVTDKKETRNTACDVRTGNGRSHRRSFIEPWERPDQHQFAADRRPWYSRSSSIITHYRRYIFIFLSCRSQLKIILLYEKIDNIVRCATLTNSRKKKKKVGFRMRCCNVFGKKERKSWRTAIDRYIPTAPFFVEGRLSISLTRHRREATSHSVLRLAEKK